MSIARAAAASSGGGLQDTEAGAEALRDAPLKSGAHQGSNLGPAD
jgi:hypothetical protein